MRLLLILTALALTWGCTKKSGEESTIQKVVDAVDEAQEAPVKYTEGLHKSLDKARDVADKANTKIKTDQTEYDKME